MIGKKLLSCSSQGLAVRLGGVRSLYPYYHRHLVTPPRVRIPFAEKVFWGLFMTTTLLVTPAWILLNLDYYKGKKYLFIYSLIHLFISSLIQLFISFFNSFFR